MKYCAKIGMKQTTRNDRVILFEIYIDSDFDKFEFGSDKSTSKKTKIIGYKSSCATGKQLKLVHYLFTQG
jgi:hypothetical protein